MSLFKRLFGPKQSPQSVTRKASSETLFFKDGSAALEFACQYLECPLEPNCQLPAVVLDARALFKTATPIKVQEDGSRIVLLRVASSDGGFLVAAPVLTPDAPALEPGRFVLWEAFHFAPKLAQAATDQRFGWVGKIVGTLKPEYRDGSWIGDVRF